MGGNIMLNKLDDILFNVLNLGLLGFLLYGGVEYAPESPATLLLGFIAIVVILWIIADVAFKINHYNFRKKMNRYYQ